MVMRQRSLLRRALERAGRLIHAGSSASSPFATQSEAVPTDAEIAAGREHDASPAEQSLSRAVHADAPALCDPHYEQGLSMARAHRWNWAQRELECAARDHPTSPAQDDLISVRAVRRQLRVLQKWPRDAQAYLRLGQAYMELELGEDAEEAFRQVSVLAPEEPAAYYFLALEYAYRGAVADAERIYAQARALAPDLPPWSAILADWQELPAS